MLDTLLALGLLLSTATQFRLADTPFGLGELCLVVWLGLTLCLQAGRPAPRSNAAFRHVFAFWLILVVAESVGMIVGLTTELFFDIPHFFHDVIAFLYLFGLSCIMAIELANEHRRRRVTWLIASLGAVFLSLQVAHAFGLTPLPVAEDSALAASSTAIGSPWFWDRLRGWANDPNQLGLAAALLTLISLHLAETSTTRAELIAVSACAGLAFSVGVLTKSDSYNLGILIAGSLFLAIKSSQWIATFKSGLTFRAASVGIALLALPMLAVAALPFAPIALERAEGKAAEIYDEDDQVEKRFHLWIEAIEKGMDAAMLGLGPGPHLTKKAWKRPPPYKFEAHNTPLDLFVQGGLLAVLALAWLYASLVLATTRAKLAALVALSCASVVFSLFHFIIRHPIFWFSVVLCLSEASARLEGRVWQLGYDKRI